jgi:hypothetical protein
MALYNGDAVWSPPRSLSELIALPPDSPLAAWQPEIRYFLFDELRYSEAELTGTSNLAAALFRLEQCREPNQLLEGIDRLLGLLQDERHRELKRAFSGWIRRVLLAGLGAGLDARHTEQLSEVRDMLAKRIEEWERRFEEQEQRLEERDRTLERALISERRLLAQLVSLRFGQEVAAEVARRVEQATPEQIENVATFVEKCADSAEFLREIDNLVPALCK